MANKVTLFNLTELDATSVDEVNSNFTDLANAIDNTLSRDGSSPNQMEANIDMNSFLIRNAGVPVNNTDVARLQDILDRAGTLSYVTALTTSIVDAGEYFTSDNVENALQELGAFANVTIGTAASEVPTNADLSKRLLDPEHAMDGGTDAYASATNTSAPGTGEIIVRDFQSANTTTTPTLDGITITDKHGNAVHAGAINGPVRLQYNGTNYLAIDLSYEAAKVYSTAYLQTTSDIINGVPVSAFRFIDRANHSAILDRTTTTDVSTQLQNAVDALDSEGNGGLIRVPRGLYLAHGVALKNHVVIRGEGPLATVFKTPDGANDDVFTSVNFATLTGSNSWFVDTEGVPHGFGIYDLAINGNKANNATGNGIRLFAKRYGIDRVFIYECAERGFYSECGDAGGQHDYRDMPECEIGTMWITSCGTRQFQYRGPHDGHARALFLNGAFSTLDGFINEYSAGSYDGAFNIDYIHGYTATTNIKVSAGLNCGYMLGETADESAIVIQSAADIGTLHSFAAGQSGGYPMVDVQSPDVTIGETNIKDTDGTCTAALLVTGNNCEIGGGRIYSNVSSPAIGVDLAAQRCQIKSHIRGFSGSGGIGLKMRAREFSSADVQIADCDTLLYNNIAGSHFLLRATLDTRSGQTAIAGPGGTTPASTEDWLVRGVDGSGADVSIG